MNQMHHRRTLSALSLGMVLFSRGFGAHDSIKMEPRDTNRYTPYVTIGGSKYFNHPSSAATSYNFFLPILQVANRQLLFSDLRLFIRSGGSQEANFQFGFRRLYGSGDAMIGIYGSFDRRKSYYDNYFNQLVVGGEHWYHNWFVGGNCYLPIGTKIHKTGRYVPIEERYSRDLRRLKNIATISAVEQQERAVGGLDAELGYAFTENLTLYLGGYHFTAPEVPTVAGPRLRFTYDYQQFNRRFLGIIDGVSIGGGIQRDGARGTNGYLKIGLKFGLTNQDSSNKLQGFERHMIELLRRDPDIVVQNAQSKSSAASQVWRNEWDLTGPELAELTESELLESLSLGEDATLAQIDTNYQQLKHSGGLPRQKLKDYKTARNLLRKMRPFGQNASTDPHIERSQADSDPSLPMRQDPQDPPPGPGSIQPSTEASEGGDDSAATAGAVDGSRVEPIIGPDGKSSQPEPMSSTAETDTPQQNI